MTLQLHTAHILSAHAALEQKNKAIQDLKEHKRVRRPWNRGMTPAALKEYEILMENQVLELIRSLDSQCGQVVVMQQLFVPFM